MTTRRSLNKLERKAHMSIHNTVEVTEEMAKETGNTRDRFGKKHEVPQTKRRANPAFLCKTIVALFLCIVCAGRTYLFADGPAVDHKSVNVVVDSAEQPLSVDKKTDPEQKPSYQDSNTSVSLDSDSGPNMNMKF